MPSGGGPSCREDGHTRTNAQLKGAGGAICGATRHGMVAGSIRQERSVGNTVNGIDASGPHCDLNNVASLFESVGHNPSQNCVSTTRDTVACHPFLGWLVGVPLVNHIKSLELSRDQLNPTWSHETCILANDWCKC